MHTTAILLVNLGSPESPAVKDVRPYLAEFLMDERVIDVPLWLRTILVKGIIVPFRSPKSAGKYKSIWTSEGSPLLVHTKKVCELVQERIQEPVYYAMRYGQPSADLVLKEMHAENPLLKNIILLPLYPHYAMSSYETAVAQIKQVHAERQYGSSLAIVPAFYKQASYIHALASSIRPYLSAPFDHILFSYHGIPERHVKKTDPTGIHCLNTVNCCEGTSPAHDFCYRHQVITTTRLTAARLGLDKTKFSYSFQSRLGRDAWLKPYTVTRLKEFPGEGIKKLLIVCPAFVSDCLETLEEIAMEGKDLFLHHGGECFTMIPALNENDRWIECLEEMVSSKNVKQGNVKYKM